jgi:MraZ protein
MAGDPGEHGFERGHGMFLGEYQHTLDAKGRVSLPAKFRAEMTGSLVVSKGLDKSLNVYSAEEYRRFEETLVSGSDFDSGKRRLRRFFVAGADTVELDSAGRISLSPVLREYAGLKKDVAVTGNGNRIEIWDADAWATYNGEGEGSLEDLAEELADAGLL